MDRKLIKTNILTAFLAQGVSLCFAIVQTLLLPKILGLNDFGYWQLFLLYAGFAGIFDLGLNNGVYLIHGGKTRQELDYSTIKSQYVIAIIYQAVFAIVLSLFTIWSSFESSRKTVLLFTWLFFLLQNSTWFLCYVFQVVNETKKFSISTIIERFAFFIPMLIMLLLGIDSFEPYIIAYVCSTLAQYLYCLYYSKDLLKAPFIGLGPTLRECALSIKAGVALLIANLAGSFVLGGMRMVVDYAWGIEEFGRLSLVLSIVIFFLAFIGQASMVLFPALRQSSKEQLAKFYSSSRDLMRIILPCLYLLYFPIFLFLEYWLPQYSDGLVFLLYLMPLCVYETRMDITCTTLFKVKREEKTLLVVNLITVSASILLSLFGALLLNSIDFTVISAVLCIIGRSIWAEFHFDHELLTSRSALAISLELLLTVIFVALVKSTPVLVAGGVYLVLYCAYAFVYRDRLRTSLKVARGH